MGYAEAAPLYRAAGWSDVLPIAAPGPAKNPPPKGWTGRGATRPSDEVIAGWREVYADHNVCLHLQPGLVGVDVDAYGEKPGDETLANLEDRFGPLPPTWRSTARGSDNPSGIRFYLLPEGVELPGILGAGIEAIQAHHRFAVVWPSVHPKTGTQYRWYDADGNECDIPPADDLPYLPAAWVRGLQEQRSNNVTKAGLATDEVIETLRRLPEGDMCSAVADRLKSSIEDTNAGGDARHDRMIQNQTALVRLGAEGHVGVMDALSELQSHFVSSITDRVSQDDATAEFDRALAGAVALIEARPSVGGDDPCTSEEEEIDEFERKVREALERIEIKTEAQARFMAKRAGDLEVPEFVTSWQAAQEVDEDIEWAIEGLIPRDAVAVLSAEKKAGKSTLVHKMIRSVWFEEKFLGSLPAHKPRGSIVLMDFELSRPQLGKWLARNGIAVTEGIYVTSLRGRAKDFSITNPTHRARIADDLRSKNCRMLVLDPAGPYFRVLGADEQSNSEMGIAFDAIIALKTEADIDTVVVTLHAGHGDKSRARGASVLLDIPDVLMSLQKGSNGSSVRTFSATGRDVDVDTISFQYDKESGDLVLVDDKDAKEQSRLEDVTYVLKYLDAAPGASTKQITTNLCKAIDGCGDTRAKKAVAHAVKLGYVTTTKEGEGRTAPVRHHMTEAGQTELRNHRIANGEL